MSCCVLVALIQKLAIEDLVEIKFYQIQAKIFTEQFFPTKPCTRGAS